MRARHKDTSQGHMRMSGIFEAAAVPKEEMLWWLPEWVGTVWFFWPLTSVTEKVSERWAQRSKVPGAEYKKDYSSIEKGEKDTAVLRVIKAARDCVGDRLEEISNGGVRSFSWKTLKMAWMVEEPGMLVGFWCEQLCQWLLYWDRETKREDGIILEMVSSILENFSLSILRSKAR